MPGWVFALIVLTFVVVAVVAIRRQQHGRIVERLPLEPGETVLLEEEGLKVFHRFRKRAVRGGGTTTYSVRSTLTDRRILLATGGPEGKHAFVILAILDFSTTAPRVSGAGYAAYREKFGLGNGYPTYPFGPEDVTVGADGRGEVLRVVVPFPEAGSGWGPPPEVGIHTGNAERYRAAIERRTDASRATVGP